MARVSLDPGAARWGSARDATNRSSLTRWATPDRLNGTHLADPS